ncbi:MarR family transcriptional regulator [Salinibacterium sp. dk2585]|uniref:MarR family winged helix-turn-helix transcriptional regulator n=1 Tax=unclassified Salinibacterium TaxID=2632331 RepID=UPI0011C25726|nr:MULTISPECIES: MarR family transcriptional regulator [unclassified Salinibacterium]QEE60267.1 MarR family transcriptional regulator [Salinibacterium sp. dk2585]TXK55339.1 MarR family transcriptional regulator [Salinibacterium sp. dk5596]
MNARPDFGSVHESTHLLREVIQLSDVFESSLARELTVNKTDLEAMEHLIQHGPTSPTELARVLGISTAAATVVVDRLSRVGHVTRQPHPTDRRAVSVVPADASIARAFQHLMPMIMGIDGVIRDYTPEQQDVITDYLRKVVHVYRGSIPSSTGSNGVPGERSPDA